MDVDDPLAALRTAVFDGPGVTDRALRAAAGEGDAPEAWAGYVRVVRETSYRVSEADIATLKDSGAGEEEIFEITVAAAVGAALDRLAAGLRVVAE